ncbi:MAG: GNAT family N-acetyltransferase [Halioglobus sp.]
MNQPPQIRTAGSADLESLAAILGNSFEHDPVMNWVIPSTALYQDFFYLIVREIYLKRGIAHVDEAGRGASLWLPPDEQFELPPQWSLFKLMAQLVLRKGFRPLAHMREQGALFAKHRPREPHFYLQFVGCTQTHQGEGVGSALLKHGTDLCDEQSSPAYLESSNEINVPLYERHGFEVIAQEPVGTNAPTAWFMWREARR